MNSFRDGRIETRTVQAAHVSVVWTSPRARQAVKVTPVAAWPPSALPSPSWTPAACTSRGRRDRTTPAGTLRLHGLD
jgi:hypothetical protein